MGAVVVPSGYMKRSQITIVILIGCLLTLPIILYWTPFQSDDGIIHASWYIHFSEQLWNGNLYPRWLVGMNSGLGSPVFFYYPPVPYFLTSLLKPLFPDDVFGWHQLRVSAALALVLSGFFCYLWIRQIADLRSALITAVLYMAGPYHLASDLYIRFSFAEFWSFVWLPLILYFTHKIVDGNRLAVVGFAIGYALLIMTHLPTTLIFSIVPICYAAVLKTDGKLINVGKIAVSMGLGAGLSAIYFYPAMAMQNYVFLDRMSIGYFSYENWLFFSNFSLWTEDKLIILLLLADLLGIAFCSFIISRANPDKFFRKLGMFWIAVAVASFLMMTELSKPIWLIFSPLQKIQYPFRFTVIITLAATFLIAIAISSLKTSGLSENFVLKVIVGLLIAAWIPATIWSATTSRPSQGLEQKTMNSKVIQSREAPEYRPLTSSSMNEIDWETSKDVENWDTQMEKEFDGLLKRVGAGDNGISKVKIVDGKGQINVIGWESRNILLHAKADTEMNVYVSQFYYPGWTARIEGDQQDIAVRPSPFDGLLSLAIPEGEYDVRLILRESTEEITGKVISLISVLCVMAYVIVIGFAKFQSRRQKR